jgi:hypothetical protein
MGVEFKVSGADTGGDFAGVQYPIAPGRLVLAADARTPAPARLLEMIAPAGFETYFVELAEAGDLGRRQELAAKYGVTYPSNWLAELIPRYSLKYTWSMTGKCSLYIKQRSHPFRGGIDHWMPPLPEDSRGIRCPSCEGRNSR